MCSSLRCPVTETILRENPYALLRKKAGLGFNEFCEKYGFARQTLISIEAGQYIELSPRMIRSLGDACNRAGVDAGAELMDGYGERFLKKAYQRWKKALRLEAAEIINGVQPTRWGKNVSPMRAFIHDTVGSMQGFSKLLKVPPSTLMGYARGTQINMPRALEEALRDIEYPYLAELIGNQVTWYEQWKG